MLEVVELHNEIEIKDRSIDNQNDISLSITNIKDSRYIKTTLETILIIEMEIYFIFNTDKWIKSKCAYLFVFDNNDNFSNDYMLSKSIRTIRTATKCKAITKIRKKMIKDNEVVQKILSLNY